MVGRRLRLCARRPRPGGQVQEWHGAFTQLAQEIGYNEAAIVAELSFDEDSGFTVIPDTIDPELAARIRANPAMHQAIHDWHRS